MTGKRGAKIFFMLSCLLLAVSLGFSAYSFAGYVSRVDQSGNNLGTKSINCSIDVSGGNDAFVNAPYIQQVGGNTQPIYMNKWSKSTITLSNNGDPGLHYKYSFVLYMPEDFAKCAMFQFLEIKRGSESEISKASKIYRMSDDIASDGSAGLTVADTIVDKDVTTNIPNDYQEYMGGDKELKISATSHADKMSGTYETQIKSTYGTYTKHASGTDIFNCLVQFEETKQLTYYRLTVNLDVGNATEYVLHKGAPHSYVLRVVPRVAIAGIESGTETSSSWSAADYWKKDEDGNYTICSSQPVSQDAGYRFQWAGSGGTTLPTVQVSQKSGEAWGDWTTVDVKNHTGLTNPTKVGAVFTQTQN